MISSWSNETMLMMMRMMMRMMRMMRMMLTKDEVGKGRSGEK